MDIITQATILIGTRMDKRTEQILELNRSPNSLNRSSARNVLKLTSEDMEEYADQLAREVKNIASAREQAFDALSHAISLQIDFDNGSDSESFVTFDLQLTSLFDTMDAALDGLGSFRDNLAKMPRLTADVNRAKNRTVQLLNEIADEFVATKNSASSLQEIAKKMGPKN